MTEEAIIEEIQKRGLEIRKTTPTVFRPDCSFLTCQIGRFGVVGVAGKTETVFHLMGCGATWDRALEMVKNRKG